MKTNLSDYLVPHAAFLNYKSRTHAQILLKMSLFMNRHMQIAVIHFQSMPYISLVFIKQFQNFL